MVRVIDHRRARISIQQLPHGAVVVLCSGNTTAGTLTLDMKSLIRVEGALSDGADHDLALPKGRLQIRRYAEPDVVRLTHTPVEEEAGEPGFDLAICTADAAYLRWNMFTIAICPPYATTL